MPSSLPVVKLENFEGPFDLLLELVRAHELDISKISLRQVADDFLQYIEKEALLPELLGDFLVVAATLLLLKVRRLLPRLSETEEVEVEDLTTRLTAYQAFRQQADWIREQWGRRFLFSRAAFGPAFARPSTSAKATADRSAGSVAISLSELGQAFRAAIARLPKSTDVRAHVRPRGRSFQECLNLFLERLQQARSLVFQNAVQGVPREETAVSFLAVLELARQRRVNLSQSSLGADLFIESL